MNDPNDTPLVTVCLTTFCSEAYIERTLKSIAAQTYPNIRCFISDDGSDDGTVEICRRFAEQDPRFIVRENEHRVGWLRNMNRVLSQDLGDFFMNVSHDDELYPNFLETLMNVLREHPDASVAYSDVKKVQLSGEAEIAFFELPKTLASASARGVHILKGGGQWWLPYHGLVRSAALRVPRKLHSNLAGEYRADQVWVFGLAISGECIRVPQALWRKNDMEHSVSFTWDTSLFRTTAVMVSIGKVILLSKIPARDRLVALLGIPYNYLRMIRWKLICLLEPSKRAAVTGS